MRNLETRGACTALGAACAGVVLFGEAVSPARVVFVVLLVVSIVGLKVTAA